jgi:hypothetical protein
MQEYLARWTTVSFSITTLLRGFGQLKLFWLFLLYFVSDKWKVSISSSHITHHLYRTERLQPPGYLSTAGVLRTALGETRCIRILSHICTKCYRQFRFKSWYGPAIQVQTLKGLMEMNSMSVNDLTREHSRKWEGRNGIQKLEPGQNIRQLSSWLEFCSSIFCSEIRDFCHFEDTILSVGVPVSDPQNVC